MKVGLGTTVTSLLLAILSHLLGLAHYAMGDGSLLQPVELRFSVEGVYFHLFFQVLDIVLDVLLPLHFPFLDLGLSLLLISESAEFPPCPFLGQFSLPLECRFLPAFVLLFQILPVLEMHFLLCLPLLLILVNKGEFILVAFQPIHSSRPHLLLFLSSPILLHLLFQFLFILGFQLLPAFKHRLIRFEHNSLLLAACFLLLQPSFFCEGDLLLQILT